MPNPPALPSVRPPGTLSFDEANNVLAIPGVRRAYAVNAVVIGLHNLNAREGRALNRMLLPLFTSIKDDQLSFCLFESKKRVALMTYLFDECMYAAPILREVSIDKIIQPPTSLSEKLQPSFDDVLAKMERQVWNRVVY